MVIPKCIVYLFLDLSAKIRMVNKKIIITFVKIGDSHYKKND